MTGSIAPNELAETLGITGLQFRNWLRAKKAAGHPLIASHIKHERYEFSVDEAKQLLHDYRADPRQSQHVPSHARPSRANPDPSEHPAVSVQLAAVSEESGHRVQAEWMGETVTTLADLLRPGLFAVVVGINPAPPSVSAGHYWQGNTGRTLWRRLQHVGLMPPRFDGYGDDATFAAGIGFTDVAKRPTVTAGDLTETELNHGLTDLKRKLGEVGAPLVIFAFKKAATTVLGDFPGNGFVKDLRVDQSEVFVMPGPYEEAERARATLDTLRLRVGPRIRE